MRSRRWAMPKIWRSYCRKWFPNGRYIRKGGMLENAFQHPSWWLLRCNGTLGRPLKYSPSGLSRWWRIWETLPSDRADNLSEEMGRGKLFSVYRHEDISGSGVYWGALPQQRFPATELRVIMRKEMQGNASWEKICSGGLGKNSLVREGIPWCSEIRD